MDDEKLYVRDYVLEEARATNYQMVPTKSKLRYQKELEKFTQWQTEKRIKGIIENVVIAYFKNMYRARYRVTLKVV
jgi:hypothetical protein